MSHLPSDVPLPVILSPSEFAFFSQKTGLATPAEVKERIQSIAKEAVEKVHPYPCLRAYKFARFQVAIHFAYEEIFEVQRMYPGAIFLDVGCCFGTDLRKLVFDGVWDASHLIGIDLYQEFIDLSYSLFNDSPNSSSTPHLLSGNIFDPNFTRINLTSLPSITFSASTTPHSTTRSIKELKNLIPLLDGTKGGEEKIRVIYLGSVFHLFNKEKQEQLISILLSLIIPPHSSSSSSSTPTQEKGKKLIGIIFGQQISSWGRSKGSLGGKEKDVPGLMRPLNGYTYYGPPPVEGEDREREKGVGGIYCHSVESWRSSWELMAERVRGGRVEVEVESRMMDREMRSGERLKTTWLNWCVRCYEIDG